MKKKLALLLMVLISSIFVFAACDNPYDKMKLSLSKTSVELYLLDGETSEDVKSQDVVTAKVSLVPKTVDQQVRFTASGKVKVEAKYLGDGETELLLTALDYGTTTINVLTKENNLKETILVTVSRAVKEISVNTALAIKQGDTLGASVLDINEYGNQYITFSPENTTQKKLALEFDTTGYSEGKINWLNKYFEIQGSKLISKRVAAGDKTAIDEAKELFGASFGESVKVKISSAARPTVFTVVDIDIIKVSSNAEVEMNVDENADAPAETIALTRGVDGIYEVVLVNPVGSGTLYSDDYYNYLFNRKLSINFGDEQIEFEKYTVSAPSGYARENNKNFYISDVGGNNFVLSSDNAYSVSSEVLEFRVDYVGYNFFTQIVRVRVVVKNVPNKIFVNDNADFNSLNLFNNYQNGLGVPLSVVASPSSTSNRLSYSLHLKMPDSTGKLDEIKQGHTYFDKIELSRGGSTKIALGEKNTNSTFYVKHTFGSAVPSEQLYLTVRFYFGVSDNLASNEYKQYIIEKNIALNFLKTVDQADLNSAITSNVFIDVSSLHSVPLFPILNLGEDRKIADYINLSAIKYNTNLYNLVVEASNPHILYIAPRIISTHSSILRDSFRIVSQSGHISGEIKVNLLIPHNFRDDDTAFAPFAIELEKTNSAVLSMLDLREESEDIDVNVDLFNNFANKKWASGVYETVHNVVLSTNATRVPFDFYSYRLYVDGQGNEIASRYLINDMIYTQSNEHIVWQTVKEGDELRGYLTTFGKVLNNKNRPATLTFRYTAFTFDYDTKKYVEKTFTQTINFWVYDVLTGIGPKENIVNISVSEPNAVGIYALDKSRFVLEHQTTPNNVALLGGYSKEGKGLGLEEIYSNSLNSGKSFDDFEVKRIKAKYEDQTDIVLMASDIFDKVGSEFVVKDYRKLIKTVDDIEENSVFEKWYDYYHDDRASLSENVKNFINEVFGEPIEFNITITATQFNKISAYYMLNVTIQNPISTSQLLLKEIDNDGVYFEYKDSVYSNDFDLEYEIMPANAANQNLRLEYFSDSVFEIPNESNGVITGGVIRIKPMKAGESYLTIATEDSYTVYGAYIKKVIRIKVADGSAEHPFEISTFAQFEAMMQDLNAGKHYHYVLKNDLVLSSYTQDLLNIVSPIVENDKAFSLDGRFEFKYNNETYVRYNSIVFDWNLSKSFVKSLISQNSDRFIYDNDDAKSFNLGLFPYITTKNATIKNVSFKGKVNINLPDILDTGSGTADQINKDNINFETFNFGVIAGVSAGSIENSYVWADISVNTSNWRGSNKISAINIGGFVGSLITDESGEATDGRIGGAYTSGENFSARNGDVKIVVVTSAGADAKLSVGAVAGRAVMISGVNESSKEFYDLTIFANIKITTSGGALAHASVGAIVGLAENVHVYGAVVYPTIFAYSGVGGVAGNAKNVWVTLSKIYFVNDQQVGINSADLSAYDNVGAIFGKVEDGEILHSYARSFGNYEIDDEYFGNIYLLDSGSAAYAGGLAGFAKNLTVESSYFDGDIYIKNESATTRLLYGYGENIEIRNAYAKVNLLHANAAINDNVQNGILSDLWDVQDISSYYVWVNNHAFVVDDDGDAVVATAVDAASVSFFRFHGFAITDGEEGEGYSHSDAWFINEFVNGGMPVLIYFDSLLNKYQVLYDLLPYGVDLEFEPWENFSNKAYFDLSTDTQNRVVLFHNTNASNNIASDMNTYLIGLEGLFSNISGIKYTKLIDVRVNKAEVETEYVTLVSGSAIAIEIVENSGLLSNTKAIDIVGNKIVTLNEGYAKVYVYYAYDKTIGAELEIIVAAGLTEIGLLDMQEKVVDDAENFDMDEIINFYIDSSIYLSPFVKNVAASNKASVGDIEYFANTKMGAIIEVQDATVYQGIDHNAIVKIGSVEMTYLADQTKNVYVINNLSLSSIINLMGVDVGGFAFMLTPFIRLSDTVQLGGLDAFDAVYTTEDGTEFSSDAFANAVIIDDIAKEYVFRVKAVATGINFVEGITGAGINPDGGVDVKLDVATANVNTTQFELFVLEGTYVAVESVAQAKTTPHNQLFINLGSESDPDYVSITVAREEKIFLQNVFAESELMPPSYYFESNEEGIVTIFEMGIEETTVVSLFAESGAKIEIGSVSLQGKKLVLLDNVTANTSFVTMFQNNVAVIKSEEANSFVLRYSLNFGFNDRRYRLFSNNYDITDIKYKLEFSPESNASLVAPFDFSIASMNPTHLDVNFYPNHISSAGDIIGEKPQLNKSTYITPGRAGLMKIQVTSEFSNVSHLTFNLNASSAQYRDYLIIRQMRANTMSEQTDMYYISDFSEIITFTLSDGAVQLHKSTSLFNEHELFNNIYYLRIELSKDCPNFDNAVISFDINVFDSAGVLQSVSRTESLTVKPLPEVAIAIDNSNLFGNLAILEVGGYKEINWSAVDYDDGSLRVLQNYKFSSNNQFVFIVDEMGLNSFIKNKGEAVTQNGFEGTFVQGRKYYVVCLNTIDPENYGKENTNDNNSVVEFEISAFILSNGIEEKVIDNVYVQVVNTELRDISVAGATKQNGIDVLDILDGTYNGVQVVVNPNSNNANSYFSNNLKYEKDEQGEYFYYNGKYRLISDFVETKRKIEKVDKSTISDYDDDEFKSSHYIYDSRTASYISFTDLANSGYFAKISSGFYNVKVFADETLNINENIFNFEANGIVYDMASLYGETWLNYVYYYHHNQGVHYKIGNLLDVESNNWTFNWDGINYSVLAKDGSDAEQYLYLRVWIDGDKYNTKTELEDTYSIIVEDDSLFNNVYYNYRYYDLTTYDIFRIVDVDALDSDFTHVFVDNKMIAVLVGEEGDGDYVLNRYKVAQFSYLEAVQYLISGIGLREQGSYVSLTVGGSEIVFNSFANFYYLYEMGGLQFGKKLEEGGVYNNAFSFHRTKKTTTINGKEYEFEYFSIRGLARAENITLAMEMVYYYDAFGLIRVFYDDDNDGVCDITGARRVGNFVYIEGKECALRMITHTFSLKISENSTFDHPTPVSTQEEFENMQEGQHYILLNDIVLENYKPKPALFGSLDGNGYVVAVTHFDMTDLRATTGEVAAGLFTTIEENTTIKNLIIDVSNLLVNRNTVLDSDKLTSKNVTTQDITTRLPSYVAAQPIDLVFTKDVLFGVLAGENKGTVTNVSVVNLMDRYDSDGNPLSYLHVLTSTKIDNNYVSLVTGGLVGRNSGAITNSFVGVPYLFDGDAVADTTINRFVNNEDSVVGEGYLFEDGMSAIEYELISNSLTYSSTNMAYPFNIAAVYNLAGFVGRNAGVISSSYVKSVGLENTLDVNANINMTGAFVVDNDNTGSIQSSFVEGYGVENYRASASEFVINSRGNIAGFVYNNRGVIKNTYSMVALSTNASDTAGFVFTNSGSIANSFTTSFNTAIAGSGHQAGGTLAHGPFNSYGANTESGELENAFYLVLSSSGEQQLASDNARVILVEEKGSENKDRFIMKNAFSGYIFAENDYDDAIWFMTENGPKLMSTSINYTFSHRVLVGMTNILDPEKPAISEEDLQAMDFSEFEMYNKADYSFNYNYAINDYGSKNNPLLVQNAKQFVEFIIDGAKDYVADGKTLSVFGKGKSVDGDITAAPNYVRQINNINFEVVGNENILQTKYKNKTLRQIVFAGNFDGNYLDLENINLTESVNNQENYGLFWQLGLSATQIIDFNFSDDDYAYAAFKNSNIYLENYTSTRALKSGVLAGSVYNSSLINITISASSNSIDTTTGVKGYNLAGGIAGLILNDIVDEVDVDGQIKQYTRTKLIDIVVQNIKVETTFDKLRLNEDFQNVFGVYRQFINSADRGEALGRRYSFATFNLDDVEKIDGYDNYYDYYKKTALQLGSGQTETEAKAVAYSGAIAGAIISQNANDINLESDINTDSFRTNSTGAISRLTVKDVINVTGENAGGLFGYVGKNTHIKSSAFVVADPSDANNQKTQLIKGYNFAGGLVAENHGVLEQVEFGYVGEVATSLDDAIANWNYVLSGTVASNEMPNTRIFWDENDGVNGKGHMVVSIGALVGYQSGGVVIDSYSKVPVVHNYAKIAGGLVGYAEGYNYLGYVYTTSNVVASDVIGGMVGFYNAGKVKIDAETKEVIYDTDGKVEYDAEFALFAEHAVALNLFDNTVLAKLKSNMASYFGSFNHVVRMPMLGNQRISSLSYVESEVVDASGDQPIYNYYNKTDNNINRVDATYLNPSWTNVGSFIGSIMLNTNVKYATSEKVYDYSGYINDRGYFVDKLGDELINSDQFSGVISTTYAVLRQIEKSADGSILKMNYVSDYNLFDADLFSSGVEQVSFENMVADINTVYGDYNYENIFAKDTAINETVVQRQLQSVLGQFQNLDSSGDAGATPQQIDAMSSVNLFKNKLQLFEYDEAGNYKKNEQNENIILADIDAKFIDESNLSANANSIWKISSTSGLPEFIRGTYSNFFEITNSKDLMDALSNPLSAAFYSIKNKSTDNDGDYVIDITDPNAVPNFARFNNVFTGLLEGEVENGINPKIVVKTGIRLNENYYGIYSLLNELHSAVIRNIDFEFEINDTQSPVGKFFGSSIRNAGLLATRMYLTTFENVNIEIASASGNELTVLAAYNETEVGLSNVDQFGVLFGSVAGSRIENVDIILKDSWNVIAGNAFTVGLLMGNSLSNTVYDLTISSDNDSELRFNVLLNNNREDNKRDIMAGLFAGDMSSTTVRNMEVNRVSVASGLYKNATNYTSLQNNGIYHNIYLGGVAGRGTFSVLSGIDVQAEVSSVIERNNPSSIRNTMFVGGIVGNISNSSIYDSTVSSLTRADIFVNADYFRVYLGGFVGYLTNNSKILSLPTAGENEYGNFADIYNRINGGESYVGGLIGYNNASGEVISHLFNLGDISIAGVYVSEGDFRNSVNGTGYAGGLVGYASGGNFTSVYNAGDMRGAATASVSTYLGGIVGYSRSINLRNFINYGDVYYFADKFNYAGGVLGYNGLTATTLTDGYTITRFYCINDDIDNTDINTIYNTNLNTIASGCNESNTKNVFFVLEFFAKYEDVTNSFEMLSRYADDKSLDFNKNGTIALTYADFNSINDLAKKFIAGSFGAFVDDGTSKNTQPNNVWKLSKINNLASPLDLGKFGSSLDGTKFKPEEVNNFESIVNNELVLGGEITNSYYILFNTSSEDEENNIATNLGTVGEPRYNNMNVFNGVIVGRAKSVNEFASLRNSTEDLRAIETLGAYGIVAGLSLDVTYYKAGEELDKEREMGEKYSPFIDKNHGRILNSVTFGEAQLEMKGSGSEESPNIVASFVQENKGIIARSGSAISFTGTIGKNNAVNIQIKGDRVISDLNITGLVYENMGAIVDSYSTVNTDYIANYNLVVDDDDDTSKMENVITATSTVKTPSSEFTYDSNHAIDGRENFMFNVVNIRQATIMFEHTSGGTFPSVTEWGTIKTAAFNVVGGASIYDGVGNVLHSDLPEVGTFVIVENVSGIAIDTEKHVTITRGSGNIYLRTINQGYYEEGDNVFVTSNKFVEIGNEKFIINQAISFTPHRSVTSSIISAGLAYYNHPRTFSGIENSYHGNILIDKLVDAVRFERVVNAQDELVNKSTKGVYAGTGIYDNSRTDDLLDSKISWFESVDNVNNNIWAGSGRAGLNLNNNLYYIRGGIAISTGVNANLLGAATSAGNSGTINVDSGIVTTGQDISFAYADYENLTADYIDKYNLNGLYGLEYERSIYELFRDDANSIIVRDEKDFLRYVVRDYNQTTITKNVYILKDLDFTAFAGTYDPVHFVSLSAGCNFIGFNIKIKNLNIASSLFGTNNGIIYGLNFENVTMTGNSLLVKTNNGRIKWVTITNSNLIVTANDAGFIASVNNASGFIGYVRLTNVSISGINNEKYNNLGGVVGINKGVVGDGTSAVIVGSTLLSGITIVGKHNIGGVIGQNIGENSEDNSKGIIGKGVGVYNSNITASHDSTGVGEPSATGGVVGKATNSTIIGSYAIKVNITSSGTNVGGLVGHALNSTITGNVEDVESSIASFVSTSKISADGNNIGGIVGRMEETTVEKVGIVDTTVTYRGTVTSSGEAKSENVGGIVGFTNNSENNKIKSVYVLADAVNVLIAGNASWVGGIVGNGNVEISDFHIKNTNNSTARINVSGLGSYVGGAISSAYKSVYNGTIRNLNVTGGKKSVNGELITISGGDYVGGVAGRSAASINNITLNAINISSYGTNLGGAVGYSAGVINAITIESKTNVEELNTVRSLREEQSTNVYAGGLVGYVHTNSPVSNSKVININVAGVGMHVGGIAGFTRSEITGCTVEVETSSSKNNTITTEFSKTEGVNDAHVGGIAGEVGANAQGNIVNISSATVKRTTIVSNGSCIGGVVGEITGTVSASTVVDVSVTSNDSGYIGGVAGSGDVEGTEVTNALVRSNGDTTQKNYVGGVTGYGNIEDCIVKSVFVYGYDFASGGTAKGDVVSSTFTSVTVEGNDNVGGATGIGKVESTSADVVTLRGNNRVGGLTGSGDVENRVSTDKIENITIVTANQYVGGATGFGAATGVYINDVTISAVKYVGGATGSGKVGDVNDSSKINNVTISGVHYLGGATGSGETVGKFTQTEAEKMKINAVKISVNLTRANEDTQDIACYIGGVTGSGDVTNINVVSIDINANVTFEDKTTGLYIGGGTGKGDVDGADVQSVNLSGIKYVGGVAGSSSSLLGAIKLEGSSSTIVGKEDFIGGIVGELDIASSANITVSNLTLTGTNHVGGVAGRSYALSGTITANNITVTAKQYVSAVVGQAKDNDINDDNGVVAKATVVNSNITALIDETNSSYVGAVAGKGDVGQANVESTKVSGGKHTGGFTGQGKVTSNATLTDVIVSGRDFTGGVTGEGNVPGAIINNTQVSGFNNVGGVTGKGDVGASNIIVNNTTISGVDYVGGVTGSGVVSGVIEIDVNNNTYTTVSGSDYVGGVAGQGGVNSSVTATNTQVSGKDFVGGLVGRTSSTISGSTKTLNSLFVTATGSCVGGVVGLARNPVFGTLKINGVSVTGINYVGGAIGLSTEDVESIIEMSQHNSINNIINGSNCVGGAIGSLGYVDENDTENFGVSSISRNFTGSLEAEYIQTQANYSVGGLIGIANGDISNLTIENSMVTATQSSLDLASAGGVVGMIIGNILGDISVTSVQIMGQVNLGGVAGSVEGNISAAITLFGNRISYYGSKADNVGGAFGYVKGSITSYSSIQSYYDSQGIIEGANNVGGIVGSLDGGFSTTSTSVSGASVSSRLNILGNNNVGGIIGRKGMSTGGFHDSSVVFENSEVSNVYVLGNSNVGGLIGYSHGGDFIPKANISGLLVRGEVENVGGIVGEMTEMTMLADTGRINLANIAFSNIAAENVGVFAGKANDSVIREIYVMGVDLSSFTNSSNVGGAVGYLFKSHLISSIVVVNGRLIAKENLGGLVGRSEHSEIYDNDTGAHSYVSIPVGFDYISGSENVGGIVGYARSSNITNVRFSGRVFGDNKVGGIVGEFTGTEEHIIESVTVSGSSTVIEAVSRVGGIAGQFIGGRMISSRNSSGVVVKGSGSAIGGIIGFGSRVSPEKIHNNTNEATIIWTGGLFPEGDTQYASNDPENNMVFNEGWTLREIFGSEINETNIYDFTQSNPLLGQMGGEPDKYIDLGYQVKLLINHIVGNDTSNLYYVNNNTPNTRASTSIIYDFAGTPLAEFSGSGLSSYSGGLEFRLWVEGEKEQLYTSAVYIESGEYISHTAGLYSNLGGIFGPKRSKREENYDTGIFHGLHTNPTGKLLYKQTLVLECRENGNDTVLATYRTDLFSMLHQVYIGRWYEIISEWQSFNNGYPYDYKSTFVINELNFNSASTGDSVFYQYESLEWKGSDSKYDFIIKYNYKWTK